MPSAITKNHKNTRSRRLSGQQRPQVRAIPIGIASVNKSGSVMTIAFDQTIVLKGTPAYTTDLAGVTAVSAAATSPTTVAVTFSAAITTATELNVPFEDPAIRKPMGEAARRKAMARPLEQVFDENLRLYEQVVAMKRQFPASS